MTNKELIYVKTVADNKSISKAAKMLFMAQPSLSQSIQRIEDSLGTPLFHRTTGGLILTYAGERYYHMATQILKMYEDFEIEISDINNLRTGRIRLGITNHLGTLVLPRVLPRFRELCPYIELSVSEENSSVMEKKLLSGELDFAVMHAPKVPSASQICYDIMEKDPFVIILSKEHPLISMGTRVPGSPFPVLDIKLLAHEKFLMLHKEQRIRQVCDAVLTKAGITQPDILLTMRNFETVQLLAAQGLGVTMVPLQYSRITTQKQCPAIFSISEEYDASWDMCVATLKSSFLSKADQLFIRLLKEIIPQSPDAE